MGLGTVLANMQRPGGSREASPGLAGNSKIDFLAQNVAPGSFLGTLENRKWLQNRTFEARSALGPSKNGLREGFRKKLEKSMKNG